VKKYLHTLRAKPCEYQILEVEHWDAELGHGVAMYQVTTDMQHVRTLGRKYEPKHYEKKPPRSSDRGGNQQKA
jgi:hypothetical protein